jgi:hypothetical protein
MAGDGSFLGVLGVISALTNLWFVLSSVLLARLRPRPHRGLFWTLVLAALVNTFWFLVPDIRGDLRAGYYLWLASFAALAAAAWLVSPGAGRPGVVAAAS